MRDGPLNTCSPNPAYIGYLRRGASGQDRFYPRPDTETVFAGHVADGFPGNF
jgi:hypothetical protein